MRLGLDERLGVIMATKAIVLTVLMSCVFICNADQFTNGLVGHYQADNGGYFDIDSLDNEGMVGFRIEDFTQGGNNESSEFAFCISFFELQIIIPRRLDVGKTVSCDGGRAVVINLISGFQADDRIVVDVYQIEIKTKHDFRSFSSDEDMPSYQLYYSEKDGLIGLSYSRWGDEIYFKRTEGIESE